MQRHSTIGYKSPIDFEREAGVASMSLSRCPPNRQQAKPYIVLVARKKVIFVHGCFWHGHLCPKGRLPKSNEEFWRLKIEVNRARDGRHVAALDGLGYSDDMAM